MAEYVTRIRTQEGDKQIDYTALANLPQADTTLTQSGKFADAKVTGEKITACLSRSPEYIEFAPSTTSNNGGYIDFHYNNSDADYTSRIIENTSGIIDINGVTIQDGKIIADNLEVNGTITATGGISSSVTSVNGQTGEVTLKAEDVGARPNTWIPTAGDVGAAESAHTHNKLVYLVEPTTSIDEDTVANWKQYGMCYCKYSTLGRITGQPSQYGVLVNFGLSDYSEVHQIWMDSSNGELYRRLGDSSGWKGWKKIISETNFSFDESNSRLTITA